MPVQAPVTHVSFCVHGSWSSQGVPSSSVHVPSAVAPAAAEHAEHPGALHSELQHTPSTQNPL
jgi:hypothetical protein